MKQMRILTFLVMSLFVLNWTHAQVSSYTFASSSGTYTEITGGTVLRDGASTMDSWASAAITIPSFTFGGTAYTTAYVSSNGFLTLGGVAPSASTSNALSTTTGSGIAICPFSADLDRGNANATTEIRWEQIGDEVVFQWKQMKRYNVTENFDFQVRLNTLSGVVSLVYQLNSGPGASTSYFPGVGIRTSATDYLAITVASGTETWAAPLMATANTNTCRFTSTATAQSFTSGQTYTFTPPTCFSPTLLSASNLTTTSADISWTAPAMGSPVGYEYIVVLDGAGVGGAAVASGSGAPTMASISGLSTATAYDLYVRSDCGAGDYSNYAGPYSFNTPCDASTIPYSEGFESGQTDNTVLANCWSQVSESGTAVWKANTSATTYNRTPRTGSWNATLYYGNTDWMFKGFALTGGTSYVFSMYARQDMSDPTYANITVSYGTDANVASMTNPIVATTTIINGDYQEISGVFSPATSGTYYVGIKGNISSTPYYISIDDISITEATGCFKPTMVAVSNILSNTADISWMAPATGSPIGYEWLVVADGAGVGATPVASGYESSTLASVSGLSANTQYDLFVRTDCGGVYSDYVGPYSFLTACDAISTFPFVETFNSTSTTEACWTVLNENADGDAWNLSYTTTPIEGNQSAAIYTDYNAGANNDYLISPLLTLTGNQRLVYKYKVGSTTDANEFEVLLSTTGKAAADFSTVLMPTTQFTNTTKAENIIDLTAYTGDVYIAFHVPTGSADGSRIYIDSVIVRDVPTCDIPTAVVINNISSNSADFSWTAPTIGSPVGYDWFIVADGAGVGGTQVVSGTEPATNMTVSTGLTSATAYDFYIRTDCGGDYSDYNGPFSFTTACDAATVPFFEGFESGQTDNTVLANCWSQVSETGANSWKANTSATTYNRTPRTGSWNATLYYGNTDWMFKYFTLTGGTTYEFSMFARQDDTDPTDADITVAYGANADAASMTNVIVATTSIIDGDYQEISGFFTPAVSGNYYIGIKGNISSTPWYISIDDISINEAAGCIKPTNVSVANVLNSSAQISYTSTAPEVQIEYGVAPLTIGTGTRVIATSSPYTLSGLSASNNYEFVVRSICGVADTSIWTSVYSFSTLCDAASIPFFEGFESGYTDATAVAGCWSQISESGSDSWEANTSATSYNQTPRTGSWNATLEYGNTDWLFRQVALTGGTTYRFEMYARQDDTDPTYANINVAYGANADAASMTNVIVSSTSLIDGDYQLVSGYFTPTTTGDYFVGIKGYISSTPWYLSIDDISITEASGCIEPLNISSTNVTLTSADIAYTSSASSVQIEYGPAPLTLGTGTRVVVSTNPATISGLASSTTYQFYMRSICGVADTSVWSTVNSFTTLCGSISTFPYTEGFEGGELPVCWSNPDGFFTPGTEANTGNYCMRAAYNHSGSAVLISPSFILPNGGTKSIEFYWKDDDITAAKIAAHDTTFFEISVDNGTTWLTLDTLSAASNMSAYEVANHDLSAYNGSFIFRFRDVTDANFSAYGIGIDDITINAVGGALSDEAEITAFNIPSQVSSNINSAAGTVTVLMPYGTNVTALTPSITVSTGAAISPNSGVVQNFTSPVQYVVTAEDGTTTKNWNVTVNVEISINESNHSIAIYPNPTNDIVNFDLSKLELGNYKLSIYSLQGQLIVSQDVVNTGGIISISLESISAGSYIFKLDNSSNEFFGRITKQ